jgi:hypothetical protein
MKEYGFYPSTQPDTETRSSDGETEQGCHQIERDEGETAEVRKHGVLSRRDGHGDTTRHFRCKNSPDCAVASDHT